MADLGLTECCGESKLRFEIWFRRRKARDLFVLQASDVATKQAWTADISRLLWRQAVHNKGESLDKPHKYCLPRSLRRVSGESEAPRVYPAETGLGQGLGKDWEAERRSSRQYRERTAFSSEY